MFLKAKLESIWGSFHGRVFILVLMLMICRMLAMYWIPLNDSTEARYAEIARLMVTSHDWVSLRHYPNQYFWAKPPLSTWTSAFSMQYLGINALAARLPALFLSLFCLWTVGRMAFSKLGYKGAIWSVGILATTFYFLLDAGTVMTDPALMSCVALVMLSFWLRMQNEHWVWGYLAFLGWGLGLLAKGLAMGVFSVLPIVVWLTVARQWKKCWQLIPWIKGSVLTFAVALPWYILAEQRMPGFLSYFIIGEHFMRFLKPGWTGDLYGFAHQETMGMIWVYFLAGTLPWSGVVIFWMASKKNVWKIPSQERAWYLYLLSFTLVPITVFTFARNIIYPYTFPVLPAFAVLVATLLLKVANEGAMKTFLYRIFFIMSGILLIVIYLFNQYPVMFSKSNDQMIAAWKKDRHSSEERLIYALFAPEYSCMFYSNGEVLATRDQAELCHYLMQGAKYIVLDSVAPCGFSATISKAYQPIFSVQHRDRIDSLYRIDTLPSFCNEPF